MMEQVTKYAARALKRIDWPLVAWIAGGLSFVVGDTAAATDKKPNNTFSEWFIKQPTIVQFAFILALGGVISHLGRWTIGAPPVVVQGDVNVQVEKEDS